MNLPKKVLVLGSGALKIRNSTGHWTDTRVSFNNHFLDDNCALRAHANLPNNGGSRGIKMRRKQIRTKEEFMNDLKALAKLDPGYLNYSHIRSLKWNDLLFEAVKYFGGWRGAVKAIGFRPLIDKRKTCEDVISEITQLYKNLKHSPSRKEAASLGKKGLVKSAERNFGGWGNALIESGLEPLRKTWVKKTIIKDLKRISHDLGHTPSMRELQKLERHDLLNATIKHFSSYNAALKKASLPLTQEMNKWSKEKVIHDIRSVSRQLGKKPTRSEIESLGRLDLKMATLRLFGSWNNAMIAAGFVPNTDAIHNRLGQQWENIVLQIASEIYPDSAAHFKLPNRGLPDLYVFDENLIIEAKINISENNVKSDVEKYLPYCDKLQIWYLYGIPPSTFSDKIELTGINKIKDFINSGHELRRQFKSLIKEVGGINVTAVKPKKVLVLGSGALNAQT
ncbi:MAG: hypothetical protein V1702_06010 [Candidatus Woesearchaeota archaeon]